MEIILGISIGTMLAACARFWLEHAPEMSDLIGERLRRA